MNDDAVRPGISDHPSTTGSRIWEQNAFDPAERLKVDLRSREWTATGETEVAVVRELARCLREISAGRVPE